MKTALLCPGPSLSRYLGREGYDLVIGVNRAAEKHPVDIWVAHDVQRIRDSAPGVIGSPLLVVATETWGVIDAENGWRGRMIEQTAYLEAVPHAFGWTSFSATSALVCAFWRGAKRIDLYGADWKGKLDWDGVAAGLNRADSRWEWESSMMLNVLFPYLRERGCEVNRICDPCS